MQSTKNIWHNGKMIPWESATIHVLSHGLHYGSGVFEGIRFYKTDQGAAIFRLKEHTERLFYSAHRMGMTLSFSVEEIMNAMQELVRVNGIESGYIRPIVFYGYGRLKVNPANIPVECYIACWPWGAYLPHEEVDIKITRYIRIHPDSTDVNAKICGHYVNGILASMELRNTHYHEALFLDANGFISEGVGENFFIVKNDVIYTPKLGTILPGITRNTVMELANQHGIQVVEKNITRDEAYQADEAFFSGTAAEITAIRSIDDQFLKQSSGRVTNIIKSAYMDVVRGKNAKMNAYLTYC